MIVVFIDEECEQNPIFCNVFTKSFCEELCSWKDGATGSFEGAKEVFSVIDWIVTTLKDPIGTGVKKLLEAMFYWLLLPSKEVANSAVSEKLSEWLAPIVVVFLVGGIIWQGFRMTISHRGEPLIYAVKALLLTAAFGGAAIIAASKLLEAGDTYSCWVLGEALRNGDGPNHLIIDGGCVDRSHLQHAITESGVVAYFADALVLPTIISWAAGIGIIIGLVLAIAIYAAALIQMFLVVIRGGSLLILLGVSQLAASGAVTETTSHWPRRLLAWSLSLIMYKPAAATVYATGVLMLGTRGSTDDHDLRDFLMGTTILLLSPFLMPFLLRFFSWGFAALGGREGTVSLAVTGVRGVIDTRVVAKSNASTQARTIATSLLNPSRAAARATAVTQVGTALSRPVIDHTGREEE